jgi:hypothetical protein
MPPIVLPLEIEETILDLLAEDDEDHSELKTCSLVCQAFLPICRKHIFECIVLNKDDDDDDETDDDIDDNDDNDNDNDNDVSSPTILVSSPTTLAFFRLLREAPEIADYIRILYYGIRIADLTIPSIQESLTRISKLESLYISNSHFDIPSLRLDWSNNLIRPALLHLLHLPTLTHFTVSTIDDFVVSDLIPCVNLKYLNIGNHVAVAAKNTFPAALPENSIQLDEFKAGFRSSDVITKLCKTRRPDGQPIIDFGSLSEITMVIGQPKYGEPETSQLLLSCCHSLTNVDIHCKRYFHGDHQDF